MLRSSGISFFQPNSLARGRGGLEPRWPMRNPFCRSLRRRPGSRSLTSSASRHRAGPHSGSLIGRSTKVASNRTISLDGGVRLCRDGECALWTGRYAAVRRRIAETPRSNSWHPDSNGHSAHKPSPIRQAIGATGTTVRTRNLNSDVSAREARGIQSAKHARISGWTVSGRDAECRRLRVVCQFPLEHLVSTLVYKAHDPLIARVFSTTRRRGREILCGKSPRYSFAAMGHVAVRCSFRNVRSAAEVT